MFDEDQADSKGSSVRNPAKKKALSRRALLKAGAAATGAAIGSDVIRGFPTIWAQEIKDIELRHVGVSYSVVKAIGDQAAKDLGFKVTMQNLDTSAARALRERGRQVRFAWKVEDAAVLDSKSEEAKR